MVQTITLKSDAQPSHLVLILRTNVDHHLWLAKKGKIPSIRNCTESCQSGDSRETRTHHMQYKPTNFDLSCTPAGESIEPCCLILHLVYAGSIARRRHAITHSCHGYVLQGAICQIHLCCRAKVNKGDALFVTHAVIPNNFNFWQRCYRRAIFLCAT